jgi:mannose-6-phosphate isomerase
MIPPGTVHGSGEGMVVLEISATTYRYTFKIYDYLRPDLNGVMRPIHIDHAFNVIKPFRRTQWIYKNAIQEPKLIRSGKGWAEYSIGDRREFFHVVYRLEFEDRIEDDTCGKFHVITLVEGDSVEIRSLEDENKRVRMNYSETILIPACFGKYQMINQGQGICKVVKARLR